MRVDGLALGMRQGGDGCRLDETAIRIRAQGSSPDGMLLPPFRARPAHVMPLGVIDAEAVIEQSGNDREDHLAERSGGWTGHHDSHHSSLAFHVFPGTARLFLASHRRGPDVNNPCGFVPIRTFHCLCHGGHAQRSNLIDAKCDRGHVAALNKITKRQNGGTAVRLSARLPFAGRIATSASFPHNRLRGQAANGPAIHLPHAGSVEDLSGQPQGARKHQSVVLSGRQDRGARPQRVGQVDAAAYHGGARHRIYRRSLGGRGRPRRLPAAGTATRSEQVRARERDGRRRRTEGDPRPVQRDRHELFGRDRGRDDQAAGRDRGEGLVGSRLRRSIRRWTRWSVRPTTPT